MWFGYRYIRGSWNGLKIDNRVIIRDNEMIFTGLLNYGNYE